jgi:hypothetical protein
LANSEILAVEEAITFSLKKGQQKMNETSAINKKDIIGAAALFFVSTWIAAEISSHVNRRDEAIARSRPVTTYRPVVTQDGALLPFRNEATQEKRVLEAHFLFMEPPQQRGMGEFTPPDILEFQYPDHFRGWGFSRYVNDMKFGAAENGMVLARIVNYPGCEWVYGQLVLVCTDRHERTTFPPTWAPVVGRGY